MNICFITPEFPPTSGGIGNITKEFAKAFIKNNDVVTVITPKINNSEKEEEYLGIKVIRVDCIKTNLLKLDQISFILKSTWQTLKIKPDVVIGQTIIPAGLASGLSGLLSKTKAITQSYGRDINIELEKKLYTRLLCKLSFLLNKKVITTCNYHKKIINKYTKKPIEIIPHIVPNIKINETKEECKKELKLKTKTNLIFVGRLIKRKGANILISAVKDIDCYVHIIGVGPEENNLKKLTKDLGLENKIIFHNRLEYQKTLKFMKASDIFVFPTVKEALAFVFYESVLMQIPIITSNSQNAGGGTDIFTHEHDALLVNRNAESFNKAIKHLIKNKEKRKILSKNALNTIKKNESSNILKKFKRIANDIH